MLSVLLTDTGRYRFNTYPQNSGRCQTDETASLKEYLLIIETDSSK